MTIASALTALNTDIVNARTAITNKGGTVTANGGTSQLATDIATIPTGSVGGILETLMEDIVAGNNPVDTTALATAETQIAAFLTI